MICVLLTEKKKKKIRVKIEIPKLLKIKKKFKKYIHNIYFLYIYLSI